MYNGKRTSPQKTVIYTQSIIITFQGGIEKESIRICGYMV